jgi:hypothetical protein
VFTPVGGVQVNFSEVEDVVDFLARRYRARVVVDPFQAIQLAQRLRAKRVTVEEFSFGQASVSRLAVNLHTLLRTRRIALIDDPPLIDELVNVKLIERGPGAIRIDHAAGSHDDRVVSLALCAYKLVGEGHWSGPVRTSAREMAGRRFPAVTAHYPGTVLTLADRRRREFELGLWSPFGDDAA